MINQDNYLDKLDFESPRLLKTQTNDAKVEALICTWSFTEDCQLVREHEIRFDYNFSAYDKATVEDNEQGKCALNQSSFYLPQTFIPSSTKKMNFQMSHDKQVFFLPILKDECVDKLAPST